MIRNSQRCLSKLELKFEIALLTPKKGLLKQKLKSPFTNDKRLDS